MLNRLNFMLMLLLALTQGVAAAFPPATRSEDRDVRRCLSAIYSAKEGRLVRDQDWRVSQVNQFSNGPYEPYFKVLDINKDDAAPIGHFSEYKTGVFIGKGKKIFLGWRGADLVHRLQDWSVLGTDSQNFSAGQQDGRYNSEGLAGIGHWGAFQMYRAYAKDVRIELDKYARQRSFNLSDLQIMVTGHSFGGMVAQYGIIDIINSFYNHANPGQNNVVAVTLGSPRVFDAQGVASWENKIGGTENHLRLITSNDKIADTFCTFLSQPNTAKTFVGRRIRGFGNWFKKWVTFQDPYIHLGHTGVAKVLNVGGFETHALEAYRQGFVAIYGY